MSDSSDRNIIMFVFIFMFIYINYLRIKIDIKNDWENMRCNPMNLWTSSFFRDPKIANSNFNSCINSITNKSIETGLEQAYTKQKEALQEISNQETLLRTHLENIEENINNTGSKYDVNESKIDEIQEEQTTFNTINDLLTEKTTNNNLYNFVTSVNNIFNNIKDYLPNILR